MPSAHQSTAWEMANVGDDLGREVLGRAAQRERAVRHLLGEAKVAHLDVAVLVKE